jgi:hypothetical protein
MFQTSIRQMVHEHAQACSSKPDVDRAPESVLACAMRRVGLSPGAYRLRLAAASGSGSVAMASNLGGASSALLGKQTYRHGMRACSKNGQSA